jgi:intein-encoded DNA endonuclease-like protein|tara:strand:+ start:9033 stop:9923 length:891 start_codon:yes stop_codon:yes gene_type:complete
MNSNNQEAKISHQGQENRGYTLQDHSNVITLRKKGISFGKIAKKVNISSATIQLWIKTSRKPRYLYAKRQQRQLSIKSRRLSSELSYIYGVLIGDGYLEKSKLSNRITLQVTDKEFAREFYNVLKNWSGFEPTWRESLRVCCHRTKYGNLINCRSYFYIVRLGSKQAVNFVSKNLKCKTKDWNIPRCIKNTNNKIIFAFFKGLFDSEGCAIYSPKYNKGRIDLRMYGKQVKNLQNLLKKVGIESTVTQGKIEKQRGMYILRILRKNSIKLFAENIGFVINRKRKILSKILTSYRTI